MAWQTMSAPVSGTLATVGNFGTPVYNNLREVWYEAAYVEVTAPVSVTATTEATATTVASATAVTFDGVKDALVEFYAPRVIPAGSSTHVTFCLYDGTSSIGQLGRFLSVSGQPEQPVSLKRRLTPSAASHTYSIRAFNTSTATVTAGAGGSGNFVPAFIRVTVRDA